MSFVLTLDAVPTVLQPGWSITGSANGRAIFTGRVQSADGSVRPALDQVVSFKEDGVARFGGRITRAPEAGWAGLGVVPIETTVTADDNNVLAERQYLSFSGIGGSLKGILIYIASFMPAVSVHPAQVDGPFIPTLNYATDVLIRDLLNDLTIQSGGYLWEIDADALLSMWLPGTRAAPFDVTAANGRAIGDVTVDPTRTGYANRVIVRTATLVAVATDASWAANPWDAKYQAPDDTTQAALDGLAMMILARSLVERKTVAYDTEGRGLAPGQSQTITIPARNLANTFLITDVEQRDVGPTVVNSRVTALEGLAYQPGWQERWRQMTGGGAGTATVSGGGGGGGVSRSVAFLGGSGIDAVSSPAPTWVPASGGSTTLSQGAIQVTLDTVARGSLIATVTVRLRALDAGVSVQARLYDVSTSTACPGLSAVVTDTVWTTVTFTATLTAGSHRYELQLLSNTANAPVLGTGFVE